MNKEYIPYSYLIGWSKLNKWYYGVEYATKTKIANPNNLWKSYFTSSKIVEEFRIIYGEPDIIQIRKTFKTAEDAYLWENKVLEKMKIYSDEKWINKNVGGIKFKHIGGKESHLYGKKRPKQSEIMKDKKRNPFTNMDFSGVNNPFYGKKHTQETIDYITKFNSKPDIEKLGLEKAREKSRKKSEHMLKNNPFKNKKHSEETKLKMSIKAKNRKHLKGYKQKTSPCHHCNKEVSAGNMKRWHGDKCKLFNNVR